MIGQDLFLIMLMSPGQSLDHPHGDPQTTPWWVVTHQLRTGYWRKEENKRRGKKEGEKEREKKRRLDPWSIQDVAHGGTALSVIPLFKTSPEMVKTTQSFYVSWQLEELFECLFHEWRQKGRYLEYYFYCRGFGSGVFSLFHVLFKKILKQHQKFASNFLMNLMKRQILFFSICVCVCVLGGDYFF